MDTKSINTKSIKTKIKIIKDIINSYQISYDKKQKQIDIILNKYNKTKNRFICINCCKKFYNNKDYLEHQNERCTSVIYWIGVGDYDRTLAKIIKDKDADDTIIKSKQKELIKLNSLLDSL